MRSVGSVCPHCGRSDDAVPGLSPRGAAAAARIRAALDRIQASVDRQAVTLADLHNELEQPRPKPNLRVVKGGRDAG